jgi:hypothetical protein
MCYSVSFTTLIAELEALNAKIREATATINAICDQHEAKKSTNLDQPVTH